MKVINARNVNDAYVQGVRFLMETGERESSRAGDVIVSPIPVTTVYACPNERVLFDPKRDANPFFHMAEILWMLGGSRDGRWLDTYVRDFSSRFAEDDGDIHGAYGYRWRRHFNKNQILTVGRMLLENITTRRAVLTMWDPDSDLDAHVRDMPCNTHVYFRGQEIDGRRFIDMTVCCRSNDIVWGAYGANAVHMSAMGELIAGLAEAQLRTYNQVSNNYHMYTRVVEKTDYVSEDPEYSNPYESTAIYSAPMISMFRERVSALDLLLDCDALMRSHGDLSALIPHNDWFLVVALPMLRTHELWRDKKRDEALRSTEDIHSPDWALACRQWMERRMAK